MCHANLVLELPPCGVVLLTGLNGSGKSALIEGVAAGLWGESLRGPNPWPAGGGRVEVETADLWTARSREPATRRGLGKQRLQWARLGETDPGYESAAKAHAALLGQLGPLELWARTHVFARRDAAEFAGATDGERMRLMEALLGLDGFDAAAKAARVSLQVEERSLTTITAELRARELLVSQLRTRIARTEAHAPPEAPDPAVVQAARESLREADATGESLRRACDHSRADLQASRARVQQLRGRAVAAACPSCRRPFDDVAEALTHLETERDTARRDLDASERQHTIAEDALRAHQTAHAPAYARLDALLAQVQAAAQGAGVRQLLADDRAALARAESEAEELAASRDAVEHRRAVLTTAAQVLGLQGVRGHLLAHALPVVSDAAGSWLARFGRPGWGFNLRASAGELAVELTGTPHGEGYKGLSEGERKRVDLALLLALGDLAASARGRAPGTLWFDEALDPPLDAEGSAQVGEALRELAEPGGDSPRAVVVIAHSPDVATTLRPDVHYHLDERGLTRVH